MKHSKDLAPKKIECGLYRHSKTGNFYEVLGVALHTESSEQVVVYRPLLDGNDKKHQYEYFVRPYEMFNEKVVIEGKEVSRFQKVGT